MLFLICLFFTLGSWFMFYTQVKLVPKDDVQAKNIETNLIVFGLLGLLFGIATFFLYPNSEQNQLERRYEVVYQQCHDKYSANDTMRNTALLAVQLQFKKMDQLSLAPTESYQAIHIICDIEGNKAKTDYLKSKNQ